MRVRVLFFGRLKDLVGKASDSPEIGEGATVRDLLAQYEAQLPRLKEALPSLALAVNQEYAVPETKLQSGDEVALLPPVSGGSGKTSFDRSAAEPDVDSSKRTEPRLGRVFIVRAPIDTQQVLSKIKRGEDGAAVIFEGVVRNQTCGRKTLYLDYQAYEPMALRQMQSLAEQALKQFKVRDVALIHRLGRLEIGETSVLIVVASAHRAAAFDACQWLIDTLKRTVPIWKKEFFEDGAVWADGEPFPADIPRANSSV